MDETPARLGILQEVTVPIVGAPKMAHMEEALGAVDLELTEAEVTRLEEPYPPRPGRGHG